MHVTDLRSDTDPTLSRRDSLLILTAITLTYLSLGIILGFVHGGVAPVLRTMGMELSALRWVYVMYLPFGLAFLWAPVVDSWRWPWLGRRTGWIVPMQWVSMLAILAIAFIEPATRAWGTLLTLGIVATIAAATMDVALDALTVEMIPQVQRAAAAGAKMGGISLGAVLGGGVLVAWYPKLDWHGTLLLIAAAMALSCLPVFTLANKDRRLSIRIPQHRAKLIQTLRKPNMGSRLLRLTLLICTLLALFNFNRLLLVDMGVSLERIGSLLGITAPLANAMASFLAPTLVRSMPVRRAAWITIGICLASASLVWLGCLQTNTTTAIMGSILTTASTAALYVVLGSLMLEWATGQQSATDYALLYGMGRFIGTAALIVLPSVIQAVGWPVFLAMVIAAFAASAGYFLRLFPKSGQATSGGI